MLKILSWILFLGIVFVFLFSILVRQSCTHILYSLFFYHLIFNTVIFFNRFYILLYWNFSRFVLRHINRRRKYNFIQQLRIFLRFFLNIRYLPSKRRKCLFYGRKVFLHFMMVTSALVRISCFHEFGQSFKDFPLSSHLFFFKFFPKSA